LLSLLFWGINMPQVLSHDELQHIEHSNKILFEHQEIVNKIVNETESMLNTYVPILKAYVESISTIRVALGQEVMHIIQSTREIGIVTKNTQDIMNFCQALNKLDALLTPELITKLKKISGE
jgi:hypothetical protein